MTNHPTKLIVDCSTGVTTEVQLTPEEIEQAKADALVSAQLEKERLAIMEAKEAARASALAKLEALGLTEEEAKAIAG